MTHEQAVILEQLKHKHGRLRRVSEDSEVGELILGDCVSDSYAFQCHACLCIFAVEPDGEVEIWMPDYF